jgi:hypothetical protein
VRQEADAASHDQRRDQRCSRPLSPAGAVRVDEQRPRGDRRHAGGEAVEPVDEVERVDHGDRPDHGDERGEIRREAEDADARHPEVEDRHAAEDERAACQDLPGELRRRLHAAHVVDDAEATDERRRKHHTDGLGRGGEEIVERRQESGHDHADEHACVDRDAARGRRRQLVHLAVLGNVDRAPAARAVPDERGKERRDGCGDGGDDEVLGHPCQSFSWRRSRSVMRANLSA